MARDLRTCRFERAGDAVEGSLLGALGSLHRGGELGADAPKALHLATPHADTEIRSRLAAAPQKPKHRQPGTGSIPRP